MNRRECGCIAIVAHRQLAGVDKELKRTCTAIGMPDRQVREVITSCRELCSNMINHGGGGTLYWYAIQKDGEVGIELSAEDEGPGIDDVDLAMSDGYSTNRGLGLGLGGVRRMMDAIEVDSNPEGTRVTAIKWRASSGIWR